MEKKTKIKRHEQIRMIFQLKLVKRQALNSNVFFLIFDRFHLIRHNLDDFCFETIKKIEIKKEIFHSPK
jgi:hypothetical protein